MPNNPLVALASIFGVRKPGRAEADAHAAIASFLTLANLGLAKKQVAKLEEPTGDGTRRRIDVSYGRLIIEVKKDLLVKNAVENAEPQLAGYLKNKNDSTGEVFAGVITDGVLWRLYVLHDYGLAFVTEFKLTKVDADAIERLQTWLDAILLTGPKLLATKERIAERLGSTSPRFLFDRARLGRIYDENKTRPEIALKKELWARLLRTALGTVFTDDDALFLDHTMLVMEAEIIAHLVVGLDPSSLDASAILAGDEFHDAGITNVVESDFFDWPAQVDGGADLVQDLVREIGQFDWSKVEHDVLKALYEAVISPEVRKALGEYYTEDWLAQRIVDGEVDNPLNQRVADVSCGSGTFVFHAIRRFLDAASVAGMPNADAIDLLQDRVFGMDIHPVSVVLARVTYLLAIGSVRLADRGLLTVPVYLGDSVQWGRGTHALTDDVITIPVDAEDLASVDTESYEPLFSIGRNLSIPVAAIDDPATLDLLIGEMADLAQSYTDHKADYPSLTNVLDHYSVTVVAERQTLTDTFQTLCDLNADGRDHIWGYFIRNQIRPIWLSGRQLDRLVGNPPWLSYRFMSSAMQAQYKLMSESRNIWAGGKLSTQTDLVGLFIARTVEQFLRVDGKFAFVVPFSVLSRAQYARFRAGKWLHNGSAQVTANFAAPWDISDIRPSLFPVPAGVIFGTKTLDDPTALPSDALHLGGRHGALSETNTTIEQQTGDEPYRSPYVKSLLVGATIMPRVLFMVDELPSGPLGQPKGTIQVTSHRTSLEKQPWKSLPSVQSAVESKFVHDLLLGSSIVPYRIQWPDKAVLPVADGKLLSAKDRANYPLLQKRWEAIEAVWDANKKTSKITLDDQIDWQGKLGRQVPTPPIRVVYSRSGNRIAAALCTDHTALIEQTLCWMPVRTTAEGHYLVAVLNSDVVASQIAAKQSKGLYGARDIVRLPWRLWIAVYDGADATHTEIADLGAQAFTIASAVDLSAVSSFTAGRAAVRAAVTAAGISSKIETAVSAMLKATEPVS